MKHTRKRKSRGLVTKVIVYRDARHPDSRPQEVTIDVRRDEVINMDHRAATVAVRTGTPLSEVRIIEVRDK